MPEQEDKQTEHDASTSRHMTFLIMFVYRHDMNEEPLGHMHDIQNADMVADEQLLPKHNVNRNLQELDHLA